MIKFRVDDVTTVLDNKKIINNISFTVNEGEMLALVGHNGAGKSTLLKTVMNMLEKQSGNITIDEQYDQNEHLLAYKQRISYLPEEPLLLPELTVMQHFQLYGMSYEIEEAVFQQRIETYVQKFDLQNNLHVYPEQLSKGMRQKAQAICSFLPDVSVLLIDEPFMGLDVYAKEYLISLMKEKMDKGTGIVLTTHQLELLDNLATTFVTLENGRIIEQGTIEEFRTITRGIPND